MAAGKQFEPTLAARPTQAVSDMLDLARISTHNRE